MSERTNKNTPSQPSFNEILLRISNDLSDKETVSLKFLLDGKLPKAARSGDVSTLQLFESLKERLIITERDTSILQNLLEKMGRKDLARDLARYHGGVVGGSQVTDQANLVKMSGGAKEENPDIDAEPFESEDDEPIAARGKTEEENRRGKDRGNILNLNVHGPVNYLITGDHQNMVINNMPASSGKGSSNCEKKNEHPVTDSRNIAQANPSISSSPSSSSFGIGTDNMLRGKMTRLDMKLLDTAMDSVGRIGRGTGGVVGTGFRVGSRYIMTASHVVKQALGYSELTPVTKEEIQHKLKIQGLHIEFTIGGNLTPIPLLNIVFYRDRREQVDEEHIDVTIAELPSDCDLPDPLLDAYDDFGTDTKKSFCLLGHDRGSEDVELGFSWTLINDQTLEAIQSHIREQNIPVPHDIFNRCGKDPSRVQLQGPFGPGGSGSPGVVVREGKVRVFIMLTHGYFYGLNFPDHLQIQEGTRMSCVQRIHEQENIIPC